MQWWTNTHTYIQSATGIDSKLGLVELIPGQRGKTSWLSLEKKYLKFIQYHLIHGAPNHTQTWFLSHQLGSAEVGICWPAFSPFVKQCCWVQWSFRIWGFLLSDCSQRFLDPCFRKSQLNMRLISNKASRPQLETVKPGAAACAQLFVKCNQ